MDPEIDELKALVARQGKVIEETNHMIRGMRRSQRWHMLFRIAWWLLVLGASGAAYYYYIQPYVDQFLHAYSNAHDFQLQVQNFFAQFGHQTQ
ncbi:MAG: hypothetical protein V4474_01170 [Patescibacteria group bacterium]